MSDKPFVGPVLPAETEAKDVVMMDDTSGFRAKEGHEDAMFASEAEKSAAWQKEVNDVNRRRAIDETLMSTIIATEEKLRRTVGAFQQLIINGASQEEFDANEKKQATLSRVLKRMKESKVSIQAKKEVWVPKNLPALQLEADKDAVAIKTKFVDVFEIVLY
ncbi:hypothetical protein [Absidia glauca]|uniref:Uncharacterized protein n=1 Tax=Absidia glauca TaxID=4829 RepID=A0A168PTY0_ABSGL|nr:hypothetical protein [Absidia glauca]